MNLTAIKATCNGGKRATIYTSTLGGGQWISNGFASYRVRGIWLDSESALMELWNMPERAREKAIIVFKDTDDPRFAPTMPVGVTEEELELLGAVGLAEEGHWVALWSRYGVIWIDLQWLKPLKLDYARYFARWQDGRPLIAVYEDLEGAEALILPVSDMISANLTEAARKMASTAFRWPNDDDEAAEAEDEAEAKIRGTDDGGGA